MRIDIDLKNNPLSSKWLLCDGLIWIGNFFSLKELNFEEFYGSLPWLWDERDYLFFSKEDRELKYGIIHVPGTVSILPGKPIIYPSQYPGQIILESNEDVIAPMAKFANYFPAVDLLHVAEKPSVNPENKIAQIAHDLMVEFSDSQIVGWFFFNASNHILSSLKSISNGFLAKENIEEVEFLVEYLKITSGDFWEDIESEDSYAFQRLNNLQKKIASKESSFCKEIGKTINEVWKRIE